MNKKHLTEAEMQELLLRMKKNYTYDAATGRLTSSRYGRTIRGKRLGNRGYLCVNCWIDKKQVFVRLHHAVWAICKGRWPEQQIDHVNGDKHDNRIENLREVSDSENKMNMLHPWKLNADTGLPGVSPKRGLFRTRICGKNCCFQNPNEAFYHATMCGKRYKEVEEMPTLSGNHNF